MEMTQHRNALQEYMERFAGEEIMVAFSGGVDSSLLLAAACETAAGRGRKVYALTVHTRLHPVEDCRVAEQVAAEMGAEHLVLEVDELEDAGIENNPKDRCYRCKKHLFSRMLEEAEARGIGVILEGTNADDLQVYRPGIRAVRELGIVSPLAELGMTKEEVRSLARKYGVSVSDRPSAPCLATRFPYGTPLSYELMAKADQGERFLKTFGFYNVRLRVHKDTARIEVDIRDMHIMLEHREELVNGIKALGFDYVTLDLEGFRSGSMDVHVKDEK